MIEITAQSIKADIQRFRERQAVAQDQLERLPVGFMPYRDHKKREQRRREYEQEIKHVEQLVQYAREALQDVR